MQIRYDIDILPIHYESKNTIGVPCLIIGVPNQHNNRRPMPEKQLYLETTTFQLQSYIKVNGIQEINHFI